MTLNNYLYNLIHNTEDLSILSELEDAYKSDDYIYKLETIIKYGRANKN